MMTQARLKTGRQGEELAAQHLQKKGYVILERNFRCPFGEMDIVARDGDILVFAEVRSRRSEGFGEPLESIRLIKQKKLSRIALCYIQKFHLEGRKARFDVLGVKIRPAGHEVEMVSDAFDLLF
jgi:putative endonuclease